jgi:outer membrane receptor for ferrienterochelin and colicins
VLGGIASCIWVLSAHVRAEEPDVASAPPIRGVESITVHGARVEALSLSGRLEAESIPAERIERLPAVNAAGIVSYLPGIRVQQRVQGEDAAVSIDGLPPEYSKLLLNGLRYSGEIGGVGDLADLPIAGVESIEVLRGPQALRFGSDAAGGVVNVITRPAPLEEGARLQLDSRIGEQGAVHATHAGALRLGDLGATWNLLHDQIDGFDPRGSDAVAISPGEGSRRRTEDVYSTLDYPLGETTRLISDLGWRFEREDLEWFDDGARSRRDYGRQLASLGAEHWTGGGTLARAQLRYFDANTESEVGRSFEMREREFALSSDVERELAFLGATHSLELGFELEAPGIELDEEGMSESELRDQVDEPDPDRLVGSATDERFTLTGLSARLETPLSSRVTLDLALRSQLHSHFGDRVLPQAALRVALADALQLRLGWGMGYRTPSLRELYQPPVAQTGGGYFLQGNPDLKAESTSGWRLGLEYEPSDWLQLGTTFFWNHVDDHIRSVFAGAIPLGTRTVVVTRPADDPFCRAQPDLPHCTELVEESQPVTANLFRKANLDELQTQGIEARILLQPTSRLSLRLGYTLMDTEVESNLLDADELPNEAPNTLDLEAMFSVPGPETEVALRARWRDEAIPERSGTGLSSFQDPTARTDRSWVLDLRLRQPLRRGFELYLDALNLTDEESVDSYEIRPRMLLVGARFDFEDLSWSR